MKRQMFLALTIVVLALVVVVAVYSPSDSGVCGIQECHGLEITCGSDVPDVCTAIYKLGDFCRQFAKCETVDGKCTFVDNDAFITCKGCVEQCDKLTAGDEAFRCEDDCRDLFFSE